VRAPSSHRRRISWRMLLGVHGRNIAHRPAVVTILCETQ
jgi:hypothetical protein